MQFEDLRARLKAKQSGKDYSARCPAHDDARSSLKLKRGEKRSFLDCFAGCSPAEICAALGLTEKDLFFDSPNGFHQNGKMPDASTPKPTKAKRREISRKEICAYDYRDEQGNLIYQNVRFLVTFDDGATDKDFRQRHFDDEGKPVWNLQGVRRVPYRLPELLAALAENPRRYILAAEGEKDVISLIENGFTASSFKNWRAEFNQYISGANVVLLRDHDRAGVRQADEAANIISSTAASVRIVDVFASEELPEKHGRDVSDWLADGHTADELRAIIKNTPVLKQQDKDRETNEKTIEWLSKPKPLDLTLKPVEKLESDCLPEVLTDWLLPAAKVIGCPFDFLVLAAVVIAGSLIGSRIRLKPLQNSNWFVVSNLYAGIVGLPSTKKTPALDETRKPILELQAKSREEFSAKRKDFEIEAKLYERETTAIYREKLGLEETKKKIKDLPEPNLPTMRRFETNDITTPKLAQFLAENPNGLLQFRDELTGWLKSLEADYDTNARTLILELWKGAINYEKARVGDGEIQITSGTLSIVGGIQPSKLQRYVSEAYSTDESDGFLQRFLFTYPDVTRRAEKPSTDDYNKMKQGFKEANKTFKNLAEFEFQGNTIAENGDVFQTVKFNQEAQTLVDQWKDEIEAEAESLQTEDEPLSAYLYKLPKSCFAIALIFHCLENIFAKNFPDEISEATALRAINYTEVLKSNARRVFALGENQIFALANTLLGKIKKGELESGFKARDVQRKQWSGLRAKDVVLDVLHLLVDYGYLRELRTEGEGRPTVVYFIHPDFEKEVANEN